METALLCTSVNHCITPEGRGGAKKDFNSTDRQKSGMPQTCCYTCLHECGAGSHGNWLCCGHYWPCSSWRQPGGGAFEQDHRGHPRPLSWLKMRVLRCPKEHKLERCNNIEYEMTKKLGCLQANLSGCPSGLPNNGGVRFSQQRLSKVGLFLQHLTRLIHPTAADRNKRSAGQRGNAFLM